MSNRKRTVRIVVKSIAEDKGVSLVVASHIYKCLPRRIQKKLRDRSRHLQ